MKRIYATQAYLSTTKERAPIPLPAKAGSPLGAKFMGRPQKPDAPWRAGATPEDLAELADIEAQAEALRQQIGELAYRRIKITAKCRSRVISKHRKESEIELGKLRKQLADGRKLAF